MSGQIPDNIIEVGLEAFTECLRIIPIFIINKQLRRKAIYFIMPHDSIYTRPSLFYNNIIEKIKVIFLFCDSDDNWYFFYVG